MGGGGGTTTTTTAMEGRITKSPYNFKNMKESASLQLSWTPVNRSGLPSYWGGGLRITLTTAYPGSSEGSASLGYLAVGWSPDGKMANGDYVIGYEGCVRSLTNAKLGSAPSGRGFDLVNTS